MNYINNPRRVFLNKLLKKFTEGDFDDNLILPFMSKETFIILVNNKLDKKIAKGYSSVLTDSEIKEVFSEMYEISLDIIKLYLKSGILKEEDNILSNGFNSHALIRMSQFIKNDT